MSADASGRMLSRLSGLSRAFIASAADETAYYMAEGESRLSREVDQNVAQAAAQAAWATAAAEPPGDGGRRSGGEGPTMAEAVDAIARERAARGSTSQRGSAGDEADQKPLSLSEVSEADLQRLGVEDPHRRSSMTVRPSMGDA